MKNDYSKDFQKLFDEMCYKNGLNRKAAWNDLMATFACAISNVVEPFVNKREKREAMYEESMARLGGMEIPATLFSYVALALDENPGQDFLGDMYMRLSMGEKAWGQVFTPYSICELMTKLTFKEPEKAILKNGYVSVLDPAVGGGAMLMASVQKIRSKGYDPSTQMLAVGQDIDLTAINMAYIQLSLVGCPAVLVHGDSIGNPYTGNPIFVEENDKYWYTPAIYGKAWNKRRRNLLMADDLLKDA